MGTLSLVSTPIGNLDDITIRAIKTLFSSDAILCEDTRHTGLLIQEIAKRYGALVNRDPLWKPTFIPYYDQIEDKKLPEIIELLLSGKNLALVTDAGTPLISDPGFTLVRECVKRGIRVESVPGASAVLASLTASGLPADKFFFLGYPPEKQSARMKLFESLPQIANYIKATYILYCAPHKLAMVLQDLKSILGDITIVVERELTKVHEERWQGTVTEAMSHFTEVKGELVLLFPL
ncbi:16S rRNA (cytidine(1402)-2'-O)-methyltransferase [Candidatus Gottesmanbacteria bacterium RBG_13_45_10]|uniref:Ribosomal RNA small subunit methyltransferase I n=1 Tax=Candidatus Gottesmanbacteria bacterium RBG_13_45_10 TaxID=1798370 RepID=A0A1F5ZHI0_9BACT|nr:MAG: 16S rRNA (cytidine(1402)-2'-O)-methyltransferase [Candidatus Gottesmanbacteria bacterium RBG_13_45_10]